MGTSMSMRAGALVSGGRGEAPTAHAFSVRVSVQQGGQWLYLQYIRPNGQPVWGPHKCNYVSRINHFSSAQRICREVFSSQMFPSGTRVQFHKQFFKPRRGAAGGEVTMQKMYEHAVKDSTVIKP